MILIQYGSSNVLQFKEVEKRVPKNGERVGKVHAASVQIVDLYSLIRMAYITLMLTKQLKPKRKVLGTDFSGTQEYEL